MRTALIPPIPHLEEFASGGTHLLLSHLFEHPKYALHYKKRSEVGDYIILDNSAHEAGKGNKFTTLLIQAKSVLADEVVVPDVLFDSRGTVEGARASLRWLRSREGQDAYKACLSPRLMYVPQGENRSEYAWCLREMIAAHEAAEEHLDLQPPVIGISKDYYNWPNEGLVGLVKDMTDLRVRMSIDIHCLGWPTNLWALAPVARYYSWVRSTDSAKPFVYAKAGILLEPGGKVPEYPRRDPNYFTERLTADQLELARKNVEVFKASASDMLIGV